MRILNRKEFLELKGECLFAKYHPKDCGGLGIKIADSFYGDFIYQRIDPLGALSCEGSEDLFSRLDLMEKSSEIDFQADFYQEERDGYCDENQHFIVFSRDDVLKLVNRLCEILK